MPLTREHVEARNSDGWPPLTPETRRELRLSGDERMVPIKTQETPRPQTGFPQLPHGMERGMITSMSAQVRPILVVDDQERLVKALVAILSRAGYSVITATNGSAAIEMARADSPGLVLCDQTMPGISGLEVFQALRADPTTAHLPFILMSGSDLEAKGLRPDAFLHKPFKPDEVLRAIGGFTKLATAE